MCKYTQNVNLKVITVNTNAMSLSILMQNNPIGNKSEEQKGDVNGYDTANKLYTPNIYSRSPE